MRHSAARTLLLLLIGVTALPAADLEGIWAGKMQGRRGEMEDVAFQFKLRGAALTGKMFGDEFDLPIQEASLAGDQVKFVVTNTNYYSGVKVKVIFTGAVKSGEMELTRERVRGPEEKAPEREAPKQTIKLKKLT